MRVVQAIGRRKGISVLARSATRDRSALLRGNNPRASMRHTIWDRSRCVPGCAHESAYPPGPVRWLVTSTRSNLQDVRNECTPGAFPLGLGVVPFTLWRTIMRLSIIPLAFAITIATLASSSPADAQARYCLQGKHWGHPGNCSFATRAQCMASASGTSASCGINPRYAFARQRGGSPHHGGMRY